MSFIDEMRPAGRIVCVLNDGGSFIDDLIELLDQADYCVFQEQDVDCFITMIAEIDPEVIVVPEATSSEEEDFLPMLRLLTDNIIAVVERGDGIFPASALLDGADLCLTQTMPEGEILARLRAFERRLLAATA